MTGGKMEELNLYSGASITTLNYGVHIQIIYRYKINGEERTKIYYLKESRRNPGIYLNNKKS